MSEATTATQETTQTAAPAQGQQPAAGQQAPQGASLLTGSAPSGGQQQSGLSNAEQRQPGETDLDWRHRLAQGLPEADRDAFINEASRSQSEGDFAKRFLDLRRNQAKMIPLPDPKNEDARREIYTKLGAPAEADAYVISPTVIPADTLTDTDNAVFAEAKPIFHKHGLTQAAVDDLLTMQTKLQKMEVETKAAKADDLAQERMTMLKSMWGRDFDENVTIYNKSITYGMGKDGKDEFASLKLEDGTYVANHPVIVRAFTKFGRERAGDDTEFNVLNQSRKAGAQEQLDALKSDLKSKGIGPGHPDYPAAELDRLADAASATRKRSPNGLEYMRG